MNHHRNDDVDKYTRTATELLPLLGGADNVIAVAHCVTRVRLSLVDRRAVDTLALRDHPAVLGQLDGSDAYYHIIVGPAVAEPLSHACRSTAAQQTESTGCDE